MSGSSGYLALAIVQMAEREPRPELAKVRRIFHLPSGFEFKYQHTTPEQRTAFFEAIAPVPFRVRAVVVAKPAFEAPFRTMDGLHLSAELACRLILRASELDIAKDVLVIDGAVPLLRRTLRLRLSTECRMVGRVRPFRKIIGGDSRREDGLQLADMIVGAVRRHVLGAGSRYYHTFTAKVVDLWEVLERGQ